VALLCHYKVDNASPSLNNSKVGGVTFSSFLLPCLYHMAGNKDEQKIDKLASKLSLNMTKFNLMK